ncbi:MAG: PIG-L deacetylase family protein [Candidatus Xenobia bacterium]
MARPSPLRSRLLAGLTWLGIVLLVLGVGISFLPEIGPDRPPVTAVSAPGALQLTASDRVLVLAPHPDDEVLGCSGIIQQCVALQVPVRVVFLTNGDANEWSFLVYEHRPVVTPHAAIQSGLLRHNEAVAADGVLGVPASQLSFLGYPDYGTLHIFQEHWGKRPPLRSILTRATAVPYANAYRPGAPYKGESILSDVEQILGEFKPTKLFTTISADYNSDHRAAWLFSRVATWDLESKLHVTMHPFLVHMPRWPRPEGFHPDLPLEPPPAFRRQISWQPFDMTPAQIEGAHQALQQHRSQMAYSARYLLSFLRKNELFGDFPVDTLTGSASPSPIEYAEGLQVVDKEWHTVRIENGKLQLVIALARPVGDETEASIYLCGWRSDRPFASMPKLHVKVSPIGNSIEDNGRPVSEPLLSIGRSHHRITLQVPLPDLGNPQRILLSARTDLGNVSLSPPAWYTVQLTP